MVLPVLKTAALAATLVQATPSHCLKLDEAREIVSQGNLIPLADATRLARGKASGDVIVANLCRVDSRLMYVLVILARGGRVVRIAVDAQTRAVQELR